MGARGRSCSIPILPEDRQPDSIDEVNAMRHMEWAEEEVRALREAGTFVELNVLSSPQEPRSVVNGREVINLCSNNYLGLTTHPRMRDAALDALNKYGVGT